MTLDDVAFVYKTKILSADRNFISSFKFPRMMSISSLDNFVDDVYKLNSIKKNLAFINDSSNSELSSLVNDVLKKESDLKKYIDSSINNLSYISSKNEAEKNVSLLSYFHHAASVLSYDSQGIKSLENAVLFNAGKYFSSKTVKSNLYFLGDSVVLNQAIPFIETHENITYHHSKNKVLLFAASLILAGSLLTFYAQKNFSKPFVKQDAKTEIYRSKKSNHNNTKPIAKYKNQNISK